MNQDILIYLVPALGIFILLVILGILLLLVPKKKKTKEKLKIKTIGDKIQAALNDGDFRQAESFSSSLSSASLNIHLQKSKFKLQSRVSRNIPEKYKFSAKMAARGMEPDEIASVFDISSAEASQLVQLSQLTKRVTVNQNY